MALDLKTSDIPLVVSTLLGQSWLCKHRCVSSEAGRQRRRWLVFDHEPFERVRRAWKAYFDQLLKVYPTDPAQIPVFEQAKWELFYDLLHEMALAVGFDQFDKTYIKNNCYRPIAHGNTEKQQLTVLTGWAEVLSGTKALPLEVRSIPAIANINQGAAAEAGGPGTKV